jgi:hypothetical protein
MQPIAKEIEYTIETWSDVPSNAFEQSCGTVRRRMGFALAEPPRLTQAKRSTKPVHSFEKKARAIRYK